MGEIVEFRANPVRKAQSVGEAGAGTNAAILFFTGVRYERHKEENAQDSTFDGGKTPGEGANGSSTRKRRRRA